MGINTSIFLSSGKPLWHASAVCCVEIEEMGVFLREGDFKRIIKKYRKRYERLAENLTIKRLWCL